MLTGDTDYRGPGYETEYASSNSAVEGRVVRHLNIPAIIWLRMHTVCTHAVNICTPTKAKSVEVSFYPQSCEVKFNRFVRYLILVYNTFRSMTAWQEDISNTVSSFIWCASLHAKTHFCSTANMCVFHEVINDYLYFFTPCQFPSLCNLNDYIFSTTME